MEARNEASIFDILNQVDVGGHTEKKNGLTYLSWAWAWGELKKLVPDATSTVYENRDGWNYFTDGRTCWVKCGVTVNGLEQIEYLPVMDVRNRSIPAESVTSMDVNKAIQRCITKAIARHGLGLYIYAGEDVPESYTDDQPDRQPEQPQQQTKPVPDGNPAPATPLQKKELRDLLRDDAKSWMWLTVRFGRELEQLPFDKAKAYIKKIKAEAGTESNG